jgi:hypothetical protein
MIVKLQEEHLPPNVLQTIRIPHIAKSRAPILHSRHTHPNRQCGGKRLNTLNSTEERHCKPGCRQRPQYKLGYCAAMPPREDRNERWIKKLCRIHWRRVLRQRVEKHVTSCAGYGLLDDPLSVRRYVRGTRRREVRYVFDFVGGVRVAKGPERVTSMYET